jgi:hypothetical protein
LHVESYPGLLHRWQSMRRAQAARGRVAPRNLARNQAEGKADAKPVRILPTALHADEQRFHTSLTVCRP